MSSLMQRHAPVCVVLLLGACASSPAAAPPVAAAPPAVEAAAARGAGGGVPDTVSAGVRFMQAMVVHHRQAVEMTALVPSRAGSDAVRLLAERIEASQEDELRQMRDWLERRGAALPDEHAHHGSGHGAQVGAHAGMPGMLPPAQLSALREARGEAFDRLFLESMIFHHEGALVMVAELFAAGGAAQDTELVLFATHVDSDQRIEIERMRRMLSAPGRDGQ